LIGGGADFSAAKRPAITARQERSERSGRGIARNVVGKDRAGKLGSAGGFTRAVGAGAA
jgi:hypothetical protein